MTEPRHRILVVGGAGGMGRAGVDALVEAGWEVVVADRAPDAIRGVRTAVHADLLEAETVVDAVATAVDALGGLDAVWNHAGVLTTGTVESTPLADLDLSFALNVRANAVLARAAIPHLRAAGGGSLLFTASAAGIAISRGTFAYTVTKSALITMTRQLALEYAGDRIRVNALCPGWVDTPFNSPAWALFGGRQAFLERVPELVPLGRMAESAEIGALVSALLSPAAAFITGQAIVVDGGETLEKGAR
jgi:NAD(P)-dependent dehydrogenase (short-subunit alcohol dehydrogenase family)